MRLCKRDFLPENIRNIKQLPTLKQLNILIHVYEQYHNKCKIGTYVSLIHDKVKLELCILPNRIVQ